MLARECPEEVFQALLAFGFCRGLLLAADATLVSSSDPFCLHRTAAALKVLLRKAVLGLDPSVGCPSALISQLYQTDPANQNTLTVVNQTWFQHVSMIPFQSPVNAW